MSALVSFRQSYCNLLQHSMPAPEAVVLATNLGEIKLELYWDHAPRVRLLSSISVASKTHLTFSNWQTCENFAQLAKRGYYNGVIFHRIVVVRPPYPKLSYLCLSSLEGFYGPGRRPDWDGQRWYQHIRSKVVRRTSSSVAHRTNDSPIHPSEDEIHPELRFTGAGILAMANSGPNTNGSFRFVSFRFVSFRAPNFLIPAPQSTHFVHAFLAF